MGLLDKFTKVSGLDPISRLADEATAALEGKLENAVSDLFAEGLKKVGFSSGITNELASRFGDSFVQGAADKYFRTATSAIERVTDIDIFDNIFPSRAKTTSSELNRLENNVANLSGTDANTSMLQYPSQIGKYYTALKFRKYTRTAPQAPATMEFTNAIVLPIPKNLEERMDLKISTGDTGIAGFALDMLMADEADRRNNPNNRQFDLAGTVKGQAGAAAYMFLTQSILKDETLKGLAGQTLGAIPNPHVAAFFGGVELRTFSFDWTFAPRNKAESAKVQEIVRQLKVNSLPTFSKTGQAAFTYPDLCFVELYPWANEKGSELIKFKPALLKNVSVSYAPNGIPSFFADTNLPTFIKISLDFQETEYFTGEDFGGERRNDGLENVNDIVNTLASAIGVDLGLPGGEAGTGDPNTTPDPAANTTNNVYSGSAAKKAAVDKIQAQPFNGESTLISTYKLNGDTVKASVGKTNKLGKSVVGSNQTLLVPPETYWLSFVHSSNTAHTSVSGPYTDLEQVTKALEGAGAIK